MENKTKVIITRSSEWMNRRRPYAILIDGAQAGSVKNGSSEEFTVAPGEHQIKSKLGFFYSPEFSVDIKQDQIIYLRARSGFRLFMPLYILLLAGVLINFFYNIKHLPRPDWFEWVQVITLSPFLLFFLYYLTIGRKKYLLLEDDKDNIFAK
jgi:hypothetical protein